MANIKTVNILTIDVEDYFQVENFKRSVKFSDWEKYESRVVLNTEKVLHTLRHAEIKATFFVLGWVAERFPQLVSKIHMDGHEVACHGYSHQLVYKQSREEFRADIKRAKLILEDIIKSPVLGYRAPSYSITEKSIWALDILMEEGFKYDSSLFPIYRDRGGLPHGKRYPHKVHVGQNYIWELPISTIKILGQNIPFSGGGYFRLCPYKFIKYCVETTNKEGHPVVVYLHPWELDPLQPRINADAVSKFRHYINLDKTEQKLLWLLNDFRFGTIRDWREINSYQLKADSRSLKGI